MSEVGNQGTPVAEMTEASCDPDFDLLLQHWCEIAAIAWEGFLTQGHGVVVVRLTEEAIVTAYCTGSPCPCHPVTRDTYDPRVQVLVLLQRDRGETPQFTLAGWPAPPDAYALTPAENFGATLH